MSKEIAVEKTLLKFSKLPKEKQMLVVRFIEGIQYEENKQKEVEKAAV